MSAGTIAIRLLRGEPVLERGLDCLTHGREHSRKRLAAAPASGSTSRIPPTRAHLPRLRLPLPVHRRRRRALVSRARGAARRGGHEVTYLTLRQWDAARSRTFRASASSRSGRGWSSTSTAGGGSGPRSASASASCAISSATDAATTSSTARRRRSSRCSPPASRGVAAATGSSSTGSRSGRSAYWREYLGWLKGTIAWSMQRLATRVGERAFCFSRLHERRLRAEGFRGPIDVDRRLRRAARPARARPGRAARRLRRAAHPREGRARPPAALARARERLPSCVPRSSATVRSGTRSSGWSRSRASTTPSRCRGSSARSGVRDAMRRALCLALPSTPRGLRPRRRRGGLAGDAERRRRRARQRRARARRGRRQRRRRAARPSRTSSRRRSSASTRPATRCAPRPPTGSRGTRGGSRSRARSRRCWTRTRELTCTSPTTSSTSCPARRAAPRSTRAGCSRRCARPSPELEHDAVPRRCRRARGLGRRRRGRAASVRSAEPGPPGARRADAASRAPFDGAAPTCCTTSSTRRLPLRRSRR